MNKLFGEFFFLKLVSAVISSEENLQEWSFKLL